MALISCQDISGQESNKTDNPVPEGIGAPFTPENSAEVAAIWSRTELEFPRSGYMVGVWDPQRGEIFLSEGKAARNHYYRIGSLTKTLTAVAVLRLAEQGKLSLDDTIEQYVPGLPNGDEVTLRMMLAMTAGLPNIFADPNLTDAVIADPNLVWEVADSLALMKTLPPFTDPGSRYRYDNSNYIALDRVISEVTNMSSQQALTELVVEPARLRHTQMPTGPAMPQPAIPGTLLIDGKARNVQLQNPQLPATAGYGISTIDDMRLWLVALVSGELLSEDSRIAQRPGVNENGVRYGLGIMRFGNWLGHSGYTWGYANFALMNPETGVVIVGVSTGGAPDDRSPELAVFQTLEALYPGQDPVVAIQATRTVAEIAANISGAPAK
jgi:D-alanyl-D-alanine carboxypeptidase